MSAITVQQMAERVAGLMEERLSIRGKGLAAKLKRGGRALPRHVRRSAEALAEAAALAQNPRMLQRIDQEAVAEAYDICLHHLAPLGRWDRRKALALGIGANLAVSLLAVFTLVVAVLVWRGYL